MKPILFNAEMVRAILDGRKTVTRRLIKRPYYIDKEDVCRKSGLAMHVGINATHGMPYPDNPYDIGDILYVRETWCKGSLNYGEERYYYKADGIISHCEWRPSIHMPKEAARIFLRVTGVRVEQLQDIITGNYQTPININKEGLVSSCCFCTHHNGDCKDYISQHSPKTLTCKLLEDFTLLWNSTIKKSDLSKYDWDANPWIWVVAFERISKEEVYETENRA